MRDASVSRLPLVLALLVSSAAMAAPASDAGARRGAAGFVDRQIARVKNEWSRPDVVAPADNPNHNHPGLRGFVQRQVIGVKYKWRNSGARKRTFGRGVMLAGNVAVGAAIGAVLPHSIPWLATSLISSGAPLPIMRGVQRWAASKSSDYFVPPSDMTLKQVVKQTAWSAASGLVAGAAVDGVVSVAGAHLPSSLVTSDAKDVADSVLRPGVRKIAGNLVMAAGRNSSAWVAKQAAYAKTNDFLDLALDKGHDVAARIRELKSARRAAEAN
jgi:hypothetical protein